MRGNAGTSPRDVQFSQGEATPGLAEVLAAWALCAAVAAAIFATYARVPPAELYNVDGEGLGGGLSRVAIFLNWPAALIATAVLGLLVHRLGRPLLAVVPLLLCLVILVPGVIDQGDLDAKWINALPALGVAFVVALTAWALRTGGIGVPGSKRGDRARIAIAAVLALVSLPWFFAELGAYIGDLPLLDRIFRSSEPYKGAASVHLGEHHGFVGFQLVLVSLLLSRQLPRLAPGRLREGLALYLSGLTAYGLGNIANDFWGEQIMKRGWTEYELPSVVRPAVNWLWAVVLLLAAAQYLVIWRRNRLG